jgi:hypothetical protein
VDSNTRRLWLNFVFWVIFPPVLLFVVMLLAHWGWLG